MHVKSCVSLTSSGDGSGACWLLVLLWVWWEWWWGIAVDVVVVVVLWGMWWGCGFVMMMRRMCGCPVVVGGGSIIYTSVITQLEVLWCYEGLCNRLLFIIAYLQILFLFFLNQIIGYCSVFILYCFFLFFLRTQRVSASHYVLSCFVHVKTREFCLQCCVLLLLLRLCDQSLMCYVSCRTRRAVP